MKHIPAIDGLRAWMAWWVVLQHILQISGFAGLFPNPVVRFMTMGGLAVLVFVIISGFVITHLLIAKQERFAPYIARRFLRIYPLYAVAVVASLALSGQYLEVIATTPWANPEQAAAHAATRAALPQHVALHAILAHGLIGDSILHGAVMSILAPAWSLSLEWQYYLVAPLLVRALLHSRISIALAAVGICSVAAIGAYAAGGATEWRYPAFLPLMIGFFLLGSSTRMVLGGIRDHRAWLPLVVFAVNLPLFARDYTGSHLAVALIPVAIWIGTLALVLQHHRMGRFAKFAGRIAALVENPRVVDLGRWSYSTYLLHIPVFVVVLSLVRWAGMPATPVVYFAALMTSVPLLVVLSNYSFRYIEQPGMRLMRTKRTIPA